MARPTTPLSDTQIRAAKPQEKTYKLFDGGGLFLEIKPNGSKLWRLKYRFRGREKLISLKGYPQISLSQARQQRDTYRQLIASNIDPSEQRQETIRSSTIFSVITDEFFEHMKSKWTESYYEKMKQRIHKNALPIFGHIPINEVHPHHHILKAVRRMEDRGAIDAAGRLLQLTGQIFKYAVSVGKCDRNPAADIDPRIALKPHKVTNKPFVQTAEEIKELLYKIDNYGGDPVTVHALKILPYFPVRPGELTRMRWEEIDWKKKLWKAPAHIMKMRKEFFFPVSKQALEILKAIYPLTGHLELIFHSTSSKKHILSENTLDNALKRMGYKNRQSPHGFRAMFSTLCNDHYNEHKIPSYVIDSALAHGKRDQIEAAYNRSIYLEERRVIMQWWGDFLDKTKHD